MKLTNRESKHTEGTYTEDTSARLHYKTVAVVDMGSSAIRMVVAEISPNGEWRRLDRVAKPIALGKDVFMSGYLSRDSMRQAIRILSDFREVLNGWEVAPDDVRVIATSAIREARNREAFLDRVLLRTGFQIEIIEGVEENHLTYLAVQHAVESLRTQFSRSNSMIIEVGGGTTEIMLLHRGKMAAAHSLRLGTVRIEQQVQPGWESGRQIEAYLRENIRVTKEILNAEMRLERVKYFVAVGGDARLAAVEAGRREEPHFRVIERDDFDAFLERLEEYTPDEIVSQLGVTYNEAEGLVPALLIYRMFLNSTSATRLIVPDVSIREGVLVRFALGADRKMEYELHTQVVASAINLGKKYHFDEEHGVHVSRLAISLFDQTLQDHGMDAHARMLLEVAAILHDIGNYIRASGHHKHGHYIVANSEIFGLSYSDIHIVANVVRYHRKAMPNSAHSNFVSLRREHRILVMKLAAILRVADALDRGHNQHVRGFTVERYDEEMVLRCEYRGDLSIERHGLELKGDMFEEVFGYRVVIA